MSVDFECFCSYWSVLASENTVGVSRVSIAVGTGSAVVKGDEAASIASHSDSGVVYSESAQQLQNAGHDFVGLLADKICGM